MPKIKRWDNETSCRPGRRADSGNFLTLGAYLKQNGTNVKGLLEEALSTWHDCSATLPEIERVFTAREQSAQERKLDQFLARIQEEAQRLPRNRPERQAAWERINASFKEFGESALGLEREHFRLLLGDGLSAVGTQVARRARRFDASVSTADILQASRNAWTACGLQLLGGKSMRLTPSIFAYSMLYPYTDNYLDDPAISCEEKAGFGSRFGQRLNGEPCEPANARESMIWALVGLIEGEYSREQSPEVFESLLRIHRAQQASIRLLRRGVGCDDVDVPALCFEKGGASVMADGYLASGSLSPDEARFTFQWGVVLQLADDLQDVRQDRLDGVLTIFSQQARHGPLDEVTGRLLQFARRVMPLMQHLPGSGSSPLRQLIQRSSVSLIISSAGAASELYTADFLRNLEVHSPFRFAFLDERQTRFTRRGGMVAKLFEAFLAGDEDEPAFPLLPGAFMPRC